MLWAGTGPQTSQSAFKDKATSVRRSPAIADATPGRLPITASIKRTYRHEALIWRDRREFLATTVPFLCDALTAGEAVMVAVIEFRARWLRQALGSDADGVHFVDMADLGRNPARILPAWRQFLDDHSAEDALVRGIGEPVWCGRRPEQIVEGQFNEALLNVAVPPDTPFWLLCLYDAGRLPGCVIEEAYRSHPAVVADGQYRGSHLYGGRDYAEKVWSTELPPIDGTPDELAFGRNDLHSVSSFVAASAYAAEVSPDRAADLAVVLHRFAAGSVQRGAPGGVVRFWTSDDDVVCEVHDCVIIGDPLVGRRAASRDQRHALWEANELCDLVQMRSTSSGTTVRVHSWR